MTLLGLAQAHIELVWGSLVKSLTVGNSYCAETVLFCIAQNLSNASGRREVESVKGRKGLSLQVLKTTYKEEKKQRVTEAQT